MRTINLVTTDDICKDAAVFRPLEARLKAVVAEILSGLRTSMEAELSGIALLVMQTVMELEIAQVVGEKGRHHTGRRYHRWGRNPGSVVLEAAKRTTPVPRAVEVGTHTTYPLQSYRWFRQPGQLVKQAYQDLIRGISTRRYQDGVTRFVAGYGTSAATVSRRMVQATAHTVKKLLERPLQDLAIAVLMIDGLRVGDQTVVVALGIDTAGSKHVLGLWQGSTENARVAKSLLEELVSRGLQTDRPLLVVIDGARALRRAVLDVLGAATPVQRCTVHKKRNVLDALPQRYHRQVSIRMTRAYRMASAADARQELEQLAGYLETLNPSAAKSLREGMDETLTLHRLGIPELLRYSLQSTNAVESVMAVVRQRIRNVKRWPDGGRRSPKADQIQRWIGAGLYEAQQNFRRIKGYRLMNILVEALTKLRHTQQHAA